MSPQAKLSEGEEFLCDFLESEDIEFLREEIIDKLKNDTKSHRIADFYLPKYKIYLEFFGLWNIESHKERYRSKRQCYLDNGIPCIVLYPENLGIIKFLFNKRLVFELNRYKMERELRAFRFDQFKKHRGSNIFTLLVIGGLLLWVAWPWDNPENQTTLYIAGGLIAYQSYLITTALLRILKGDAPVEKNYFEAE